MVPEQAGKAVQLSICVIGRNEGRHLAACAQSLEQLAALGIDYETVFVDSASTDDSVAIAQAHFGKVICLTASKFLNAGAARHVGTNHCSGTWILYMDGDMELCAESLPVIEELIRSGREHAGLCAYTENVFPDGTRNLIEFKGNVPGKPCRMIGGTSILPRSDVIAVGNWACTLFAYEESELYSRLLAHGVEVSWQPCRLVEHKTPKVPTLRKLVGVVVPYRSYLGKKFYGAGQVTQLTLRNGNFRDFARLKPDAYLMSASLVAAGAGAPVLGWYALAFPSAAFVANCVRSGLRGAINNACWQSQLVCGLGRLESGFTPVIEQVLTRSRPQASPARSLP